MRNKPYQDPEKLAWALHTSNNYSEAAEKLDCSTGTISVWKKKLSDELEEYGPDDFSEQGPDPDEVSESGIRERIIDLLDEYEEQGDLIRVGEFGIAIELSGSVSKVAGKDLNPFIAISEHKLSQEHVERAREEGVGVIKVMEDSCEVVVDAAVTHGSGARAILTPEVSTTIDKYMSRAWLQQKTDEGVEVADMARECSVTPRTIRDKLDEFGVS